MNAWKVSFATDHYYTRAMYPWHLHRPGVVSIEQVEETDYVRAACVFSAGVSSPSHSPKMTEKQSYLEWQWSEIAFGTQSVLCVVRVVIAPVVKQATPKFGLKGNWEHKDEQSIYAARSKEPRSIAGQVKGSKD